MRRLDSWTPFVLTTRAGLFACLGLALCLGLPKSAFATCVGGGTGNGVVEPGEECDDGASGGNGTNGSANSCCTTSCTLSSKIPDLFVGELTDTLVYRLGNMHAFAVGTTSCSVPGADHCWIKWYSSIAEHPVIGQNMFRLKNGRFEQIGQAWLKHGFTALQNTVCSSCLGAPNGQHLGVGCSDPYVASLNDDQNRLGPKSHVDASNGVYTYPDNGWIPTTGDAIFKRLQVHNEDLDPGLNGTYPSVKYFVEGQYVSHDDALAKVNQNNASYRRVVVTGAAGSGNYNIALQDSTQRQKWALEAWKAEDPAVDLYNKIGDGFLVGVKATSLGGGVYHYEYAVMNMVSGRSAGSFSVPVPAGATVTNIGFHDVDYHSGEPYDGTDWPGVFAGGAVTWATVPYATNPNANALRWGTLYNFRFDCNYPPSTATITIGYFTPGSPTSTTAGMVAPDTCNSDGVCGTGETCANCAADCSNQGGGTGCCGNGVCQAGENPCRCNADCGAPTAHEGSCTNGIDEDCDNQTDCTDVDCCTNGACLATDTDHDGYNALCDCNNGDASVYPGAAQLCDNRNNDCSDPLWPALPGSEADGDSDGVAACANDCDDTNGAVWATPSETNNLQISLVSGVVELTWTPPIPPGGAVTHFDILRSDNPPDFTTGTTCVATNITGTLFDDPAGASIPGLSSYLIRARNACPNGLGVLGYDSNAQPIPGMTCP
jgi:hypothetical protein